MKKELQVGFKNNYQLIKADNTTIALILGDFFNTNNIQIFLDNNGNIKTNYGKIIPKILKNYDGRFSKCLKISEYKNLVPNILIYSLATLISGTTVTPTFKANYIALGSSTTTPASGDTTLGTETLRGTFTNRYAIDNVAFLDKFFTTSEVGGNTYKEAGIFVDGGAGSDTGYLLSHVSIDETVAVSETLTINSSLTINDVT